MARAPRRREREIVAAAAKVFRERGYDAATTQDIADSVGILKGSLYYYIETKEDLLFKILQEVHASALRNIELTRTADANALQKIRMFVTLHVEFNIANLVAMGVFFHDFRSLSEPRQQEIIEARHLYDEFLRELIRDGQTEGLVCREIDPKLASLSVLGMTNWVYQWYDEGGDRDPNEVARAFADQAVAGLACSKSEHVPGHRSRVALVEVPVATAGGALTR